MGTRFGGAGARAFAVMIFVGFAFLGCKAKGSPGQAACNEQLDHSMALIEAFFDGGLTSDAQTADFDFDGPKDEFVRRVTEVDEAATRAENACTDAGLPRKLEATQAVWKIFHQATEKAIAQAAPDLPRDPPPLFTDATTLAEAQARLAANAAYNSIWDAKHRDDLNAFLTFISQNLSSLNTKGSCNLPLDIYTLLKRKKLDSAAVDIGNIDVHEGGLPGEFVSRLGAHLDATLAEPHLGTWSPAKPGKLEHDYSGLAAWVRRDRPDYVREFLKAHSPGIQGKQSGPYPWRDYVQKDRETGEATFPFRPALGRERPALTWLAALGPLEPNEVARLRELAASKLGDDPPESVEISKLLSEYRSNEVRADGEFKGHVVEVSGVADEIKKNALDQINVVVGTGQQFEHPKVYCEVPDRLAKKAATYSKGDDVTVRGRVRGMVLVAVVLDDCEFSD